MSRFARLSGLIILVSLAVSLSHAAPPTAQKNAPGTITIIFKDGHRQTFSLSDIERVEWGGGGGAAVSGHVDFGGDGGVSVSGGTPTPGAPSRGHFLGKWEVGDGNGNNFYITLYEDGGAYRSLRNVRGHWVYVDGEARITWDDGAQDAIRRIDGQFQKFAYSAGKLFTDEPDNVTSARNTTPHPI
jgi:hypothetical protein